MRIPFVHIANLRDVLREIFCISFASFSIFLIASCQTPAHREFEKVRVGMTKAEVIEAVGGPQSKLRRDGADRWIYIFEDHPHGQQIREIHFENGKSSYVGVQIKNRVTPDAQDRINEIKAKVLDEKERIGTGSAKGEDVEVFLPVED